MKPSTAVVTTHDSNENNKPGKVQKKAGKRIGYNYIIIKSLKKSQKNDVVKCLYIKSLINFGICVIKEGSSGDSKDKEGRDIRDRLIWQKQLHGLLDNKIRLPHLLGSFEENGNYYLVIERIKGKSLGLLCKKYDKELRKGLLSGNKLGIRFLDYLQQVVNLVGALHKQNIIHRDVTVANFMITPGGKVVVIDMELSYSLEKQFPSPPFQLGTYGYMSPQQEATQPPSKQDDIFSLGAILLQVWTGISPVKFTNVSIDDLADRIRFFIPDQPVAEIAIQCLHPNPDKRPELSIIWQTLDQFKTALKKNIKRADSKWSLYNKEDIQSIIQNAVHTLASPLLADPEKGWFSENRKNKPNADKNKIDKAWYASFNVGTAGVIYMLSKLKMVGLDVNPALPFVKKGLDLIEQKYILNGEKASSGLHFGAAGISASLAAAIRSGLIEFHPKYINWMHKLLDKENDSLGIMHGLSGQGIAQLICTPFLDTAFANEHLQQYVQQLLNKQEKDGSWVRSIQDKKNRITRGFANGMAGNIYFLLEYASRYNDNPSLAAAENGLHWLMKKAHHQHQTIQWLSSNGKNISHWWCEGAPGIALSFLKAYQLLGVRRYKEYAIGALSNHPEKTLDDNLSQCHGLTGLGEIYLEAYFVLGDEAWLKRAEWIAQVLLRLRKQHREHGPYWLVEHERQPLAGFMAGNSGILHFLLRYCYPEKINFPLTPGSEKVEEIAKSISPKELPNYQL